MTRALPTLLHTFETRRVRLDEAVAVQIREPRLPPGLPADLADDSAGGSGVYVFRGDAGVPIYVGMGRNLRSRVLAHFSAPDRETRIIREPARRRVVRDRWRLGALLLESRLIRELAPLEHRRLRAPRDACVIRLRDTGAGATVAIESVEATGMDDGDEAYGPFGSEPGARRALEGLARGGSVPEVDRPGVRDGSCFARQNGRCRGACLGIEPRALHDARLRLALALLRLRSWPFPGAVAFREPATGSSGSVLHVIDRWRHVGSATSEEELQSLAGARGEPGFDVDTYRILTRWLRRVDARACIPLPARGPDVSAEATVPRCEFFAACPRHVPSSLPASCERSGGGDAHASRGVGFEGARARPASLSAFADREPHRALARVGASGGCRAVLRSHPRAAGGARRRRGRHRRRRRRRRACLGARSTFAAQKAKDAIVDRFRERDGARPSVDFDDPDLRVSVRFGRDRAAVGIDLAGRPLHQRGYRQSALEAPLKENLAAALLLRCGWPEIAAGGGAFVDPMCGSGTIVIEAALIAANIAPGLLRRRFGFERWRQHDPEVWARLRAEALAARTMDALNRGGCADSTATRLRSAPRSRTRTGLVSPRSSFRATRGRRVVRGRRGDRARTGQSALRRASRRRG